VPRLYGVKERINAVFYDALIRTVGNPSPQITRQTRLFSNPDTSSYSITNINAPGQFSSDQTLTIYALRSWIVFAGTNAIRLLSQTLSQLYYTVYVGEKPLIHIPLWFIPSGGGSYGGGPG
jgi:hypothetical protein